MRLIHRIRKYFDPDVETLVAEVPLGLKGRLFGSPMPFGPYDKYHEVFDAYKACKIRRVVVLVTEEEIEKKAKRDFRAAYAACDMLMHHVPIADMTSLPSASIDLIVPQVLAALRKGENVAVHCNAGVGRTGVIIACLTRVARGGSAEDALKYVAEHMRINLTSEQKRSVMDWESKRNVAITDANPAGLRKSVK